eukprot:4453544-Alexandrium_andersonii.AAC.1
MLGRQVLWVIRRWFDAKKECQGMCALIDLTKLRLHGDNDTQRFFDQWVEHASGLKPGIPKHTIREVLYEQLKNSAALKPDLEYYDRLPLDATHPDRSEVWLLEMMRLMLERWRHQANRQAQAQHLDDVNKPRGKGGRANVAK